jgi:maleylacetoacetate isomerase
MPVGLLDGDGQQHSPEYRALNPQGLVPTLVDGELVLSQSLAIIEYLDELVPEPPLLPRDPPGRARARQLADIIACDIHPLNNLRVQRYLQRSLRISDEARLEWSQHWIVEGFDALELWLTAESSSGPFCLGGTVSIADVLLIPQLYNARRYHVSLDDFPTLCEIEANCNALEAFRRAAPDVQPDAPKAKV